MRRSPVLANWPEKLQNDVMVCFSNAVDLNPLIEACTRLIASGQANDGQLVSAYSQRGFLQRLSQPDRALDDYNAALKLQPNSPGALTNRAYIYLTRARNNDAMADLNKAIERSFRQTPHWRAITAGSTISGLRLRPRQGGSR